MNMDEDIVEEILLRLPAKSLIRFRSVCKSWYAIIKSSKFIKKHHVLQRAVDNDHIIVNYFKNAEKKQVVSYYTDYESLSLLISAPEVEIPGYNDDGQPIFVGEVNGIVCLTDTVTITLMNPCLREFRMLPPVSYYGSRADFKKRRLYRPIGVGFGFDESTNDYKILLLDVYEHHIGAVYNLRSNSWRELGRIPLLESYLVNNDLPYLFFNGSVHWYANRHSASAGNDMIITFNMTTESFQEMHAPHDHDEDLQKCSMLFVVDKSFMKFVSITQEIDCGSDFLNVWVMNEYGVEDSWTKEYRIQVISSIEKPLSFWKTDKLLFNTSNETELICYDLPTGRLHQVQQFDSSVSLIGLVVFNESLFSIINIEQ